jgi:hypothetical protein
MSALFAWSFAAAAIAAKDLAPMPEVEPAVERV